VTKSVSRSDLLSFAPPSYKLLLDHLDVCRTLLIRARVPTPTSITPPVRLLATLKVAIRTLFSVRRPFGPNPP
jgi:hypothetical protein